MKYTYFITLAALFGLFQTKILSILAETSQLFPPIPNTSCGIINRQPFPSAPYINQLAVCLQQFTKYQRIAKQQDHGFRTDQVIQNHGYHLVTYNNITSSDGYIQTMFRITGSPKSPPRKGKQSVLLIHGLGISSTEWVLLGNQSLAFVLADAGYEVWLPNARGSDYSDRHVNLNAYKDFKYWDFTFHEMSVYDIPVYINLILKTTGRDKLFTISHSLGVSVITATLAEKPELNDKILANFMYGSTVKIMEFTQVTYRYTEIANIPPEIMNFWYDNVELGYFPLGNFVANSVSTVCMESAPGCGLCDLYLALSGLTQNQFNLFQYFNFASRVFNNMPSKTFLHLAQSARTCMFQKFDSGPAKNLKLYGQPFPPSYNLKNVKAPVYIYYGDGDMLTTMKGQLEFARLLPPGTVKAFRRVPADGFDHNDFILNKDAYKLIYLPIINEMKQYKTET